MFKIMLGFAAGWWVGTRQATGQPVVPDDVRAIATKYAKQPGMLVATQDDLRAGNPQDQAIPAGLRAIPEGVCFDSFNNIVDCRSGRPFAVQGFKGYRRR